MIGRDAEFSALVAEATSAAAGRLRCVLLQGEPGIGKTRLATELLATTAATHISLAARAHPLSGTASFGLWVEALDGYLRELPADEVVALCDGFLDDLSTLLRSVAAVRGAVPDKDSPRPRLLESLAALLRRMSAGRPVVIFLDDVHQADASSWDALHYLATKAEDLRVLVVLCARAEQLTNQPLAMRVLLDLEQGDVLRQMVVDPLGNRDLRKLGEAVLAQVIGDRPLAWLAERSRGNPLIAIALLEALQAEGGDLDSPALRAVPRKFADSVRVQLGTLGPQASGLAEVLAAAGGALELRELLLCSGRPLDDLAPAVDQLVRSRLIVERIRGNECDYQIAHPLIEETIYSDLSGIRRFTLHRAIGRALLALGRIGEAALHFAKSCEVGDDEAIGAVRIALRQAEQRGADQESLQLLGALSQLLPARDPRWESVAEDLADRAEWVWDHRAYSDARHALRALKNMDAVLGPDSDPMLRVTIKSRLTTFLIWGTGELELAVECAQETIDLLSNFPPTTPFLLTRLELAYAKGHAGDIPVVISDAEDVLRQAIELNDPYAAHHALGVIGSACSLLGRFDQGAQAFGRSIDIARDLDKPYRVARGLMNLGWLLGQEGDFSEALIAFGKAKAIYPGWRETLLIGLEAGVRWLAGDLEGCLACARETELLDPEGFSLRRGIGFCYGALAATEGDRPGEARRLARAGRRVYGDSNWYFAADLSRYAEARVSLREGKTADAILGLTAAAENLVAAGSLTIAAPALLDVVEAAAETDPVAACAAAEKLAEIAGLVQRDMYDGMSSLATSLTALSEGDVERARKAALQSVEIFGARGDRLLLGRAEVALARATEDPRQRAAILRNAAASFDSCKAVWRRNIALAMGAAALDPDEDLSLDDHGPSASLLTLREREVAELAAQRLSGQEIAERLHVSRRTVDSHLAKIYTKLGIRSKIELAQRMSSER
jgi:DNA-binding CsgD family transcriptional regulator